MHRHDKGYAAGSDRRLCSGRGSGWLAGTGARGPSWLRLARRAAAHPAAAPAPTIAGAAALSYVRSLAAAQLRAWRPEWACVAALATGRPSRAEASAGPAAPAPAPPAPRSHAENFGRLFYSKIAFSTSDSHRRDREIDRASCRRSSCQWDPAPRLVGGGGRRHATRGRGRGGRGGVRVVRLQLGLHGAAGLDRRQHVDRDVLPDRRRELAGQGLRGVGGGVLRQ